MEATDELEFNNAAPMKKRWMLTINNPIFADSNHIDENIQNTDLEIVEAPYDLSFLQEAYNKDLFDYHYIKVKDKIIRRPFFKDLASIETYLKNLKEYSNLKYAVYQYEMGESGTKHIQGFVIYKNSKRFANVKQDFPTACIKEPNGSNADNRNYCTKKDTRIADPIEIGEFSEMRSRNDIVQFLEMVKAGATNIMLENLFPVLYATFTPDKIEKFRQDFIADEFQNKFRDIKVTYIYGDTRLGKTTFVYDKYKNDFRNICRVNDYGVGSFETYHNQRVLMLDEFDGQFKLTFMNNLLDRYPMELPARFANRQACFTEVYIISNLPLKELYKKEQEERPKMYAAFCARITDIIHYTDKCKWHYELKDGVKQIELVQISNEGLPW
jgi:hypothetical protein